MHPRLPSIPDEHRPGTVRFLERLHRARSGLTEAQRSIVAEHVIRLGERGRNPANTGNIEDLFFHTLAETQDPCRAFAQALADSAKVVPLPEDAALFPYLRTIDGRKSFRRVGELSPMAPGDIMLVSHTMVAYGDPEMWRSAQAFVAAGAEPLSESEIEAQVYKMAVQSQHLPSSAFVMGRARGFTIECQPMYERAGYDDATWTNAQRFYDICSRFDPDWSMAFRTGTVPASSAWISWRKQYLDTRSRLPDELQYQLSSDTLTNFLEGTLESGKWTDASVQFGGVTRVEDVPVNVARIVNQYVAEHVALHDRPAQELIDACSASLLRWGIGFVGGRAEVVTLSPEKRRQLEAQFASARARFQSQPVASDPSR
ncbi:MAG: hypothetical protein AAGD10_01330 [Myxococcota bacterium]